MSCSNTAKNENTVRTEMGCTSEITNMVTMVTPPTSIIESTQPNNNGVFYDMADAFNISPQSLGFTIAVIVSFLFFWKAA